MKRKAIMFIAAAAASAIALIAAGCGGGSHSSQPQGSPVALTVVAAAGLASDAGRAGWGPFSPASKEIDSDD